MLGDGLGEGDGVEDGLGVGLCTDVARALLETGGFGMATWPGPTPAKYSASGTTIMPATTVSTKVTAPHSRLNTPQFTSR